MIFSGMDGLYAADKTAEKQLEEVMREHAGLVRSVALRLSYAYNEDIEDLMQIGYIGLIKAARRFDPDRGLKFSTYAVPMITGEIKSQLRDQGAIKVSRSLKADAALVKRMENDFITASGRSPRLSELAEVTGLSQERITEALTAADALRNFDDYEKADLWTDNEEKNITSIDLRSSISHLPEREKRIIRLRYYKDLTQQQVAGIMGLSQVQVCRIEKTVLKELAEKV